MRVYIQKLVKMRPYPVLTREETLSVSNEQKEEHVALEETCILQTSAFHPVILWAESWLLSAS